MRRREFIAGLLLAATMGRTRAQQTTKAYRIAFVDPATSVAEMNERTNLNPFIQAFFRELRQLGYVEGQNILIERYSGKGRAAAGQTAYYPGFVGEVVRQKPDLIFVMGNHLLLDFKAETTTIPIVGAAADPVAAGIVPSLSRPGGNITGVSPFFDLTIWSKYVEYLTEAAPKASRIGLLASHYGWETAMGAAVREATQG
jgi:putative tryptophan/tyrosine transport system substrate-binding protein